MKKMLLLGLLLTAMCAVSAQNATLTLGAEAKVLCNRTHAISQTQYIGANAENVYLVQKERKKNFMYRYDKDMNELAKVEIPDVEDETYYGGYLNENTIDLLVSKREKDDNKGSITVYRETYDPKTLERKGERVELDHFSYGLNDQAGIIINSSPDHTLLAILSVVQPKDDDADVKVALYTTDLEELWKTDCSVGVMDDFMVTDSGEVVLAGFYNKKGDDETHFEFSVLDGEKELSGRCDEAMGRINRIDIVKYAAGKIYLAGLLRDPNQDKDDTRSVAKEYFSILFDMGQKRMIHYEHHLFSKEDLCRIYNTSEKRKPAADYFEFPAFLGSQDDAEGALVGYNRFFTQYVNYVPMSKCVYGMFFMRIDNQGHISWTKTVRREAVVDFDLDRVLGARMSCIGNKTYVFYVDHLKNMEKEESDAVKSFRNFQDASALVMLDFDINGKITRQSIELPKKSTMIGGPRPLDAHNFLLLLARTTKSNFGYLQIP